MASMKPAKVRRSLEIEVRRSPGQRVALGVFALLAVLAPVLFGAVDRLPQIILLGLLGIGILAQPPAVVPLSRWGNRLAIAFFALLLVKEFGPAKWFGQTLWHTALTRELALDLPFTHNPEPARALDALLTGVVAIVWFLWVRRLAAERENRPALAWSLFAAVAIVAAVSFAMREPDPKAIFGLRYTPGWSGFGPFPNRNHSADLFAMGAVLGCGCLTWAALQKKWFTLVGGGLLLGLIVLALLTTESRGGLMALGLGLLMYVALCLCKLRSRRAVGVSVAAALVFAAIALSFGSSVFARFQSHSGDVSSFTRIEIWRDTIAMWKDAPLLGHGLNTFTQIFPLYEHLKLDNQVVLHPESSWLQWLTELGAIALLLAMVAGVLFFGTHIRESFYRNRSFFLRAGGFAAGFALLGHSFFDVPGHRWGTAGFALAALAIACPMRIEGRRVIESRRTAFVPLGVAILWVLPLIWYVPDWSPLTLFRVLARSTVPGTVPLAELETTLRYFPLEPELHQRAGLAQLQVFGLTKPGVWQREFAIAARLTPSSWYLSSAQARACQRISPALAIGYWQQAIERGSDHREEIFRTAVEATSGSPLAAAVWGRYATDHPDLLLRYAQIALEPQGAYYYALWWKDRALSADLSPDEIREFYDLAPRWGSRVQFDEWMLRRAKWQTRDFRQWAALLHTWGDAERAWQLLSNAVPEPDFPRAAPGSDREQMESRWRLAPQNFVNAQQLALARYQTGETFQSDELILAVAEGSAAPSWFGKKAAYILARHGRTGEAVARLLRAL